MQKEVDSARLLWNVLKRRRQAILLGLAFGAAASAIVPQLVQHYQNLTHWLSNPGHFQKTAVIFLAGVIVASVLLLWLLPISVKWWRSWWASLKCGAFAVPAIAAFLILRLQLLLSPSHWCIASTVILVLGVSILFVSARQTKPPAPPGEHQEDPRVSLSEAWPQRRDLARQIARYIQEDGKPTYAIYGDFGSGKSSMLNFIEEALSLDPRHKLIIVRFNGWLPGSKENLADQLFSDIATECSKEFYVPHLRHAGRHSLLRSRTTVPAASGPAHES